MVHLYISIQNMYSNIWLDKKKLSLNKDIYLLRACGSRNIVVDL